MRLSAENLVAQLEDFGLTFSKSTQLHEGHYLPQDAEWNYKDIPHLNFTHELVEGVHALIEPQTIGNVFIQRVGPLKLPLAVLNYSSGASSQVYFTSTFGFLLIVSTSWSLVENDVTRVETSYYLGSSKSLRFIHPIVHSLLKRNYQVLMKVDVPMRLQRGNLRSLGFCFKPDQDGYKFDQTLKIYDNNLVRDSSLTSARPNEIEMELPSPGQSSLPQDLFSLNVQIRNINGEFELYPHTCPHEGADLSECGFSKNAKSEIQCPWHGRRFKGIAPDGVAIDGYSCALDKSRNRAVFRKTN